MKNAIRSLFYYFLASLILALQIFAQTTVEPTTSKASQQQRIGVDLTKRIRLTLRDAIAMALENNREIEVERFNVRLNEFDLRAAEGTYDPTLITNLYYDRRKTPIANLLAGGPDGGLLTDNVVGNAALAQRVPWQGGNLQAAFNNDRSTTSNLFNSLNPQISTSLTLTYTQPLWRNRGIDGLRRQIKIAKKRLDISDSQFRQRAIEVIAQVQHTYWDLVFAQRDHEIKREAVDLARTQLEHNQRLVEAGALAPTDVTSARVEVERRTDEAEAALDAIQRSENALKELLLQPNNTDIWNSILEPTEQPQIDKSSSLPLDDALKLAYQNRPELQQYRLRSELNKIDSDYFRNQTRPQIDFFVSYGAAGLAGRLRETENPFTASNILLFDRVNQLSQLAGLAPLPPTNPGNIPNIFFGGYGQSLANLFKNNFRAWQFGVNINLPLRNRTAQAHLGRALAEGHQLNVQRQRIEQRVEVEVRNALQAVETSRRRVEAARNSRINAELQYQSEQRKFDAGQSNNFFVLDRQNALSSARGRELKALTDYTKAVAELQRVLSTTLASNSIELKRESSL